VATDVGDSAGIIQDTGAVVRPCDPDALFNAWQEILGRPPEARAALGRRARERIVENYEISEIARTYDRLYDGLCAE
jgi:glycosyltransferase involved in cell wall biosynthesis